MRSRHSSGHMPGCMPARCASMECGFGTSSSHSAKATVGAERDLWDHGVLAIVDGQPDTVSNTNTFVAVLSMPNTTFQSGGAQYFNHALSDMARRPRIVANICGR